MEVTVLSFVEDPFVISLKEGDTILNLKEKIFEKKKKFEIDIQTIVFRGKILGDKVLVKDVKNLEIFDGKMPKVVCLVKIKANNTDIYSSKELQIIKKEKEEILKKDIQKMQNSNQTLDNLMQRLLQPQQRVRRYNRPIPLLSTIGKKVLSEDKITHLKSMGFSVNACVRALFLNKNNLENSVNYLLRLGGLSDELTFDEWIEGCKSFGDFEILECVTKKVCTYTITGNNFYWQKWYHCKTCNIVDNTGICETCMKICHKGHEVYHSQKSPSSFFCDCGHGGLTNVEPCKCCPKRPGNN